MAHGKKITLFLMDGDPNGRWTCELSNWTGKAYKIPRTLLKECASRQDLKQAGVYFLLGRSGSEVYAMVKKEFFGDGFWSMIDKLRQGRKVIITSDHGYGVVEQFSSEIKDSNAVGILKSQFKAQRYAKIAPPQEMFMPPFFVCNGECCIVTGQRK